MSPDFATLPPQDLVIQIPIDAIFIGEKRKKRFDPKNPKNQHFLDGMDRAGLINPVDVRPIGEKYELICGRRRLWAAKALGWNYIMATVGEWHDDEIAFMSMVENAHRGQLTAVQEIKVLQDLMREYERLFGKDPGRKIGGRARAASARRDPVTKQFVKGAKKEAAKSDVSLDAVSAQPASVSDTLAGNEVKSEEGEEPASVSLTLAGSEKSHVQRVHSEVGKGLDQSKKDTRLAKVFTDEQLTCLGACTTDVTKADLEKLAKIKDAHRRVAAINMICTGQSVDDAIAEAVADTPEMAKVVAARKEEAMPDQEWVESYCAKRRNSIENPKAFDRSAILYRKTRDQRAQFRAKAGKEIWAEHQAQPTSFTWMMAQALHVAHPADWLSCDKCLGLNVEAPHCLTCRGTGFKVKIEWPTKTK